eukprot:Rmarinus@m.19243
MESEVSSVPLVPRNSTGVPSEDPIRGSTTKKRSNISIQSLSYVLETAEVLHDISCNFHSNETVAIVGPRGSGRTTLLNILCGRATYGTVMGTVSLNGKPTSAHTLRQVSGFVGAGSSYYPSLTLYQTLMFTARLCLPYDADEGQRQRRVHEVLEACNLMDYAAVKMADNFEYFDTPESFRTALAEQMLSSPTILCLDDFPSSMHALVAQDVVHVLKQYASNGNISLCAIDSPKMSLLECFDRLILLSEGEIAYDGPPANCFPYLSSSGFERPQYTDHESFLLEVLVSGTSASGLTLPQLWSQATKSSGSGRRRGNYGDYIGDTTPPTSWWHQVFVLFWRQFDATRLDRRQLNVRLLSSFLPALLIGFAYLKMDDEQSSYPDRLAALFLTVVYNITQSLLTTAAYLPLTRMVLRRELKSSYYTLFPHFIAHTVCLLLFQMCFSTIFAASVHWLADLRHWKRYLTINIICGWVGTMLGLFVGSLTPSVRWVEAWLPSILVPFQFFAGYLLEEDDIPPYFKWIYYLSCYQYGYQTLAINEFEGLEFADCNREEDDFCPLGEGVREGEDVLDLLGYDTDDKTFNLLVLLVYYLATMTAAYQIMRRSVSNA